MAFGLKPMGRNVGCDLRNEARGEVGELIGACPIQGTEQGFLRLPYGWQTGVTAITENSVVFCSLRAGKKRCREGNFTRNSRHGEGLEGFRWLRESGDNLRNCGEIAAAGLGGHPKGESEDVLAQAIAERLLPRELEIRFNTGWQSVDTGSAARIIRSVRESGRQLQPVGLICFAVKIPEKGSFWDFAQKRWNGVNPLIPALAEPFTGRIIRF